MRKAGRVDHNLNLSNTIGEAPHFLREIIEFENIGNEPFRRSATFKQFVD